MPEKSVLSLRPGVATRVVQLYADDTLNKENKISIRR